MSTFIRSAVVAALVLGTATSAYAVEWRDHYRYDSQFEDRNTDTATLPAKKFFKRIQENSN